MSISGIVLASVLSGPSPDVAPMGAAVRNYDGPTALAEEAAPLADVAVVPAPTVGEPYWALVDAQATASGPPPRHAADEEARPPSDPDAKIPTPTRFVVAPTFGVSYGPPIPGYGEFSLFLGASLPRRARAGNFIALGAQAVYTPTLLYHQHLTMHGVAGAESGLMYSLSAGLVYYRGGSQRIIGGELEGRLGYVFTQRPGARVRGMFGALVRLGGVSDRDRFGRNEYPLWQVGAFVGFTRAPVGLAVREPGEGAPPRGLGLLIPGAVLVAGVGAVFLADVILFSSGGGEGCHGCVPLTVFALPALLPGVPLAVAGAIRRDRYRKWKARVTFAPRPTGVTMQF